MSYSSTNVFPPSAQIANVREFLMLLGYRKKRPLKYKNYSFENYEWYEETDYRSWTGVELSIDKRKNAKKFSVSTRTPAARSYYDLQQQNRTITALRERFGGSFTTDAGVGKRFRASSGPPSPAVSGCHIAFSRFGSNLGKVIFYTQTRTFKNQLPHKRGNYFSQLGFHPENLSGNMLMAFCVSIVEDYLKSCFVALLKYSSEKERFLRGVRLRSDQLAKISSGEDSVESAVAETLSFQRISLACKNFENVDRELDLAGALRKPFGTERANLFDELEALANKRNLFVHQALLDLDFGDKLVQTMLHNLDGAMTRVQKAILKRHNSKFDKTWGIGGHREEE
jgi:hypothetical protein